MVGLHNLMSVLRLAMLDCEMSLQMVSATIPSGPCTRALSEVAMVPYTPSSVYGLLVSPEILVIQKSLPAVVTFDLSLGWIQMVALVVL